jgi:peptidoglycan-associated lipoprotein
MRYLFPSLCWAVIAGGFIIACTKKPKGDVIYSPEITKESDKEEKSMLDPNEKIIDLDAPNWTIYFGFDSFSLRETYKAAALGNWMLKNGSKVSLSGFTSEEGTDEYNLALGAKRAQAVRDYLEAYGVPVERISWQSYGEENQVTTDRTKFHLNRRVEIKIEGVN